MRRMNSLELSGIERFRAAQDRGARGLLTFSNHVSLFDDPLLLANFGLPGYARIRWVAADALNFFGSPWKAWLFTAGKCVPIVRGGGAEQDGMTFLCDRLREGAWVHIFPEGGRTRDPQARLSQPFRSGVARLITEAKPLALPFYHYGMHDVLRVGGLLPRRGKRVRVVFGDVTDCDAAFIANQSAGAHGATGALVDWAYGQLRSLELQVHPQAGATGAAGVAS